MSGRPTTIRFSDRERALLEAAAEELDVTMSVVVRRGSVGYAARTLDTRRSSDDEPEPAEARE